MALNISTTCKANMHKTNHKELVCAVTIGQEVDCDEIPSNYGPLGEVLKDIYRIALLTGTGVDFCQEEIKSESCGILWLKCEWIIFIV